ncbi:MAG: NAD(+) diphosphatase [Rhodospirillaceae bacterium]|nr:NAD(+) diphosphatase [Rhodospirillaceae bacterium]
MTSQPLTYTANALDRATLLRGDTAHVQTLLTGGAARIVLMWNLRHLIDDAPRLQTLSFAAIAGAYDPTASTLVFLGLQDNTPWFALGLPNSEAPPALDIPGAFTALDYRALNEVVALLPGEDASILAYARAMILWHHNHRHCGRCGAKTAITESGHSSTCVNPACAHRTFPRTDPVVIALITRGDKQLGEVCLLGRQAAWPPGMYSCIAGFVEPGETLENAVRREAAEETGVIIGESVGDVRYVASQPWPFPASIMLGFQAAATSAAISRNDLELEDCRWFTKDELRAFGERNAAGPGFKLPNRYAIARLLIDGWLVDRF